MSLTPQRGVFAAGTSSPNFHENEPIFIEDTPPPIVIDPNVVDLCDSSESSESEEDEVDPVWGRRAPVNSETQSSRSKFLPRRNIMSIMDINLSDSDESDDDSKDKARNSGNSSIEARVNAIFE